jgi:6-phospho-beta-glucosidase
VKVAVVGAGSTYTPELVSGLARERDRLGLRELVLHDIVTDRLEIVGGLARRMLDAQGYRGAVATTTNLDRAIEGADFVLFQLRVGGQQTRLLDETLPLPCGCVGQETTGMGGFALALRTVPVVLEIAARVREIAAPDAWIVDFTNPVGIVTRALLDAGHRAIGLCNVAIGFQRRFAAQYGVLPERVLIDQVGLNHLTWIRAVLVDGVDVLDELLAERLEEIADEVELPARLLRELGAIPSYYLRYFYAHDQIVGEQRTGVPRAATVDAIERQLLDLYQDPTLTEKPALLEQRGGAYYSEAAVGLVTSLASDGGEVHVVDVRNNGTVAGLADDDVVELPARVDAKGAAPLPQRPLAPDMLGLVQHAAAYERLAVRAALTGDPVVAHRALLAHPLIGQDSTARALLDTFLEAEGDFLPQFAVPAARP